MDRADEIAAELWDKAWDCNRAEGLALITEWMRKYAAEAVAAERERCKGWVQVLTPHEPGCPIFRAGLDHDCDCRRSILLGEIAAGRASGVGAAQIRGGSK